MLPAIVLLIAVGVGLLLFSLIQRDRDDKKKS